jgi:hypothetical protein
MAERRAISSSIWRDADFGRYSLMAMVVWCGLFSKCADDQGRLEDDAALIRNDIFPYKDYPLADVEDCLNTFEDHIIRYEFEGRKYIQIVAWWEHQPLKFAVPSKYPRPEGWTDRYRTYYKGASIVFNWPGMENTREGELLNEALKNQYRVSVWTDYIGTLNTNPNPNTNPELKNTAKKSPTKKETAKKPAHVLPQPLNTLEFQETWERWIVFRKEIKHPITESTAKAQLKMLSAHSPPVAIAMLDQSITNGWTGIFDLKNNGKVLNKSSPSPEPDFRMIDGKKVYLPPGYKTWDIYFQRKAEYAAEKKRIADGKNSETPT